MTVEAIEPLRQPIDAVARIPGSKSITNRALLAAALADGVTELTGALHSDDTRYMAAALNALGVTVETDEPGAVSRGWRWWHLLRDRSRSLCRQRRNRDALPHRRLTTRTRQVSDRRR